MSFNSKRILFFLVQSLLFLSLIGCSTTPVRDTPLPGEPVAEAPQMQVGDSWVVEGYSSKVGKDIFTYKVIDVDSDGEFVFEESSDKTKNIAYIRFNKNFNRVDDQYGTYLNFPLFVGKQWKDQYRGKATDGSYYNFRNTYKVVEFENIVTRAGKFLAFKILRNHYNITNSGTAREIYWYAPDVKYVVKSKPSWRIGHELISYSLNSDGIIVEQKKEDVAHEPIKTDNVQVAIAGKKVIIGILEIQPLNDEAENAKLGKVFTEILTTSFLSSEAFNTIDREQLDKALSEIKPPRSGSIDTSSAIVLGNTVGADAIVTGNITKLGDGLRLDIWVVDVKTALILAAETIEGKVDIGSIGVMTDTVVNRLVNRFYRDTK
jgi:TolB-like protein